MRITSPTVALCFYQSTIQPRMEYCKHAWAGAPTCYLDMLEKQQKQVCRTVGPSFTASIEPMAHD